MISELASLGRRTLTNLICVMGNQFKDWSSEYRLYSDNRLNMENIFNNILEELISASCKPGDPLITALDDTIIKKSGKKTPHVKYVRDPMGPPFNVNFIRGQRVIQMSAAIKENTGGARMIPVMFEEAPFIEKPKQTASPDEWDNYHKIKKNKTLSHKGTDCIARLRNQLNARHENRALYVSVDGGYTNKNVFRNIPENTVMIGRIRYDARLFAIPDSCSTLGRRRSYGEQLPTPEELRKNERITWKTVPAYATGKTHHFQVKIIKNIKWRPAGADRIFQLVSIKPLGYRLSNKSRVLYRQPAYILCSDPDMPIAKLIQYYLWRWDIEVNFRDEKTILGLGQTQVRNPDSIINIPQMIVASYSSLLLSGIKAFGPNSIPQSVPQPKWRQKQYKERASTMDYIKQLRFELWASGIQHMNFSGFRNSMSSALKPKKCDFNPQNALFYSIN